MVCRLSAIVLLPQARFNDRFAYNFLNLAIERSIETGIIFTNKLPLETSENVKHIVKRYVSPERR